jgi:hypothetical protein
LALLADGKKFTRKRSDARAYDAPMPAQIIEREVIVAIEHSRLGLHPDKRGAKDFSDQAGPQFFRAHQRARDFRCAIILLRKGLILDICLEVSRRG